MSQGGREHSIVGASGFDRWSVCPGSVQLQLEAEALGYAGSSSYAREGTVAHIVAADCVEKDIDTWMWIGEVIDLEKDGVREQWTVTAEMAEAVQTWVDTICRDIVEYTAEGHDDWIIHVEVRFDLSDIREGMFGTSDIVLVLPQWGMLQVYDYKHGAGIPVEPQWNGQLLYYAVGAMHWLSRKGNHVDTVELVVVQPRNFHGLGPVRRWHADISELMDWMEFTLLPAVDRTQDPNAPLVTGDHCRFCPAKMICPELQSEFEEFTKMAEQSAKPLSDVDLATYMERAPAVRHFLKALEDEAFNRMVQGNQLPGFKLVRKQSRREWTEGAEEALKEKLGDKAYKHELISPAQAEKMAGMKDLVHRFSHKPDTGRTLAPESDSRPSLTPVKARDSFGHLT